MCIRDSNAIVVTDNASSLPAGLSLGNVNGPMVAMRTNPSDQYGKVLIVAGTNGDEVLVAAQAMALRSGMLNGADSPVTGFTLPAKQLPDAEMCIRDRGTEGPGGAKWVHGLPLIRDGAANELGTGLEGKRAIKRESPISTEGSRDLGHLKGG